MGPVDVEGGGQDVADAACRQRPAAAGAGRRWWRRCVEAPLVVRQPDPSPFIRRRARRATARICPVAQSRSSAADAERRRQPQRRFVGVLAEDAHVQQPLADPRAGAASGVSSMPAHRPLPRISDTAAGGASARSRSSSAPPGGRRAPGTRPCAAARAPRARRRRRAGCRRTCCRASPGRKHAQDLARGDHRGQRHDAAAQRLAQHVDVGLHVLVLAGERACPCGPKPDWISSAIMSTLCCVQSSRARRAGSPSGGTTTPASPWIGSTRKPTTSGSRRATAASASASP